MQLFLESTRGFVEAASQLAWHPSDGFLPVIQRAILRRQFDSLQVVVELVEEERGYAAPPLLRPSCEELIWIKYLTKIEAFDAEALVRCLASREMTESLKAQDDYGGPARHQGVGAPRPP